MIVAAEALSLIAAAEDQTLAAVGRAAAGVVIPSTMVSPNPGLPRVPLLPRNNPPTATVTIKPAAKSRPISGRATAPGPARGPARDPGAPIVTGQGSARVILTPAPSRAVSAAGREIMYICIKYFEIRLVTSNFNDLVTFNECICFIIRS